jgi:hypothetical protein
MDGGNDDPTLDHAPKPLGIATMGEKVSRRLLSLLAKRAKATIFPPPFFKAVRRPQPISDGQPREEFDLGGSPIFSHHLVEVC